MNIAAATAQMALSSEQNQLDSPGSVRGQLHTLQTFSDLEKKWRLLESESDCSFFQSWSWIGTWLDQVRGRCQLRVYEAVCNGNLVALAIIGIDRVTRRLFIGSETITLNEAPDLTLNMFIEYNGILARKGYEQQAWQQFLQDLCSLLPSWDEIRLTNIPEPLIDEQLTRKLDLHLVADAHNSAWIASLADITDVDSIISKLGKGRRWQLRRTIREYQKEGSLTIDAARNAEEAVDYFQQMGVLHSERWQRAGKGGAFARSNWVEFHRNLIKNAFDLQRIQLLRIRCGERNIGFIYNFIWRGSVLVLQTGFACEDRNILRPGYVSHLLAIQLNASLGARHYDFMIGDSEYKSVLGKASSPQVSVRLQKKRLIFGVERLMKSVFQYLR